MCEAGEAAGEQSAVDHTQNRLFSAGKKDTLRSIVGQLKYSRGSESNTQDEYFFLTKTRHGLAVGEKMSCSCQDQNCLARMPGDFHREGA